MIRNDSTAESRHVANWFLAGGKVEALIDRAEFMAADYMDPVDELAFVLEKFVMGAINSKFDPTSCSGLPNVYQPAEFYNNDAGTLLLPLIGESLHRVSFECVATLILENWPTTV